jgi:hypothetical protein
VWNDGMMYDIEGKPICRAIHFDYINSHIDNSSFYLKKVLKYLRSHKKVKNAEIIEIPYYNQQEGRERGIEFTYLPGEKEFQKIAKMGGYVGSSEYVMSVALKLNRFKKPEVDDDE